MCKVLKKSPDLTTITIYHTEYFPPFSQVSRPAVVLVNSSYHLSKHSIGDTPEVTNQPTNVFFYAEYL